LKSLLRAATAGAALLLGASLALHQAGRIDAFRVRGALGIVSTHRDLAYVSPTGVEWPEQTFAAPRVFEDGRRLGPGNSRLWDIRSLGMGRYRFVGRSLYFSSSDGTDPRLNGRRYRFEAPWPVSRNMAVLVYLLLGGIAFAALRHWLAASLLYLTARAAYLVEPDIVAPTEPPASRPLVAGFAELDGKPLLRWESRLVAALAIGLAVTIVVWFLASPSLASMTLEYALKSVPHFSDGSLSSILDFNGVGDPRGRVVNSFFTWLNILVRRELLLRWAIHPALSVNWLLYPLTLIVLNRAIRRMSRGPRYAIVATLLYAASPGMLDTLVDYHMPGKALVNFLFAAALFGVALIVPAEREVRPVLGALIFGAATFLGLLSDETAALIPICVCVLFGREILFHGRTRRTWLPVIASFSAAGAAYLLLVLVVVPLCNALLQQAPLDLPTTILRGPYAAMFGIQPRAFGGMLEFYDPISLLHTVVSAHLVPRRVVFASWTSHLPYPSFPDWPLPEQLSLGAVLVVIVTLVALLPPARMRQMRRFAAAFLVYTAAQALLLVALSGYVCESAYYAALSSLLVALVLGFVAAASDRSPATRILSWALVAYVMAVEAANMVDTARRHPYRGAVSLSWQDLRTIRSRIAAGEVDEALAAQPFPARRFLYAFEVAAAVESAKGSRIDFRPLEEPQRSLARQLDVDSNADPSIVPSSESLSTRSKAEGVAVDATKIVVPIDDSLFRAGAIVGEKGAWGYKWLFDGTGAVVQRSWRYGLMRLWSAEGRVERRAGETCLVFTATPSTCFSSLYQESGWILALGPDGSLVTRFKRVSEPAAALTESHGGRSAEGR
jgi:hypothetical protein